jgi:hypothetical protein
MIAKGVDAPPIVTSCIGMGACMAWCTGACAPWTPYGLEARPARPATLSTGSSTWKVGAEITRLRLRRVAGVVTAGSRHCTFHVSGAAGVHTMARLEAALKAAPAATPPA